MTELSVFLADDEATEGLRKQIATHLELPAVVYLHGDLGAGKTTLSRGVMRGFGHQGAVKSPTYTLVEPYEFGDDASKKTGLWLKNLPPLQPTKMILPRWICCGIELDIDAVGIYGCANCCGDNKPRPRWGNQTNSGQNKHGPSRNRWKIRAETWPGIAEAMANQWGE